MCSSCQYISLSTWHLTDLFSNTNSYSFSFNILPSFVSKVQTLQRIVAWVYKYHEAQKIYIYILQNIPNFILCLINIVWRHSQSLVNFIINLVWMLFNVLDCLISVVNAEFFLIILSISMLMMGNWEFW